MAIKVKKLVRDIRNKVKDMDEVTYSDFDIQDALNECISYFNMDKALRSSDSSKKFASSDHYLALPMPSTSVLLSNLIL